MKVMDDMQIPDWLVWLAPAWILFVILLSVLVRKARGKPIVPGVPLDAIYSERSASGAWASNCLIVAVTPEALIITPRFPFNLMFLPEIYGLERTVPRYEIIEAEHRTSWIGNVEIALRAGRALKLKLRDPEAFLAALEER